MAGSKGASMPPRKDPDKTKYSGRLAIRIRAAREKTGMSVEALVKRMNDAGYEIYLPTYYHWENGQRQPQLDALPILARILKVSLHDLLPPR
jgi:transcriptional regulator with XRE-family HTH domain